MIREFVCAAVAAVAAVYCVYTRPHTHTHTHKTVMTITT